MSPIYERTGERVCLDTPIKLPDWYLADAAPTDRCPCQWGPCGHCMAGRHHQCTRRAVTYPETWIVGRNGYVARGDWPVWTTGTPCRWICPCTHEVAAALVGVPDRMGTPDMLALLSGSAA